MRRIVIYIFIVVIGITSLSSYAEKSNSYTDLSYKICKIDSVKNWYIIYAERNDSIFKIVSMKKTENQCEMISVGKRYDLLLRKRLENTLSRYGLKLIVMSSFDIQGGTTFDPDTDVYIEYEKGVFGLYTCSNLYGLCLKLCRP
jgi:hypothetical protein